LVGPLFLVTGSKMKLMETHSPLESSQRRLGSHFLAMWGKTKWDTSRSLSRAQTRGWHDKLISKYLPHLTVVILLATVSCPAHAATEKYYIDPSQFTAGFQIPAQDNKNISGTFTNATGSYAYDTSTKTLSNVRLAVDAASLSVATKAIAYDIQVLFNPQAFPEITFSASSPINIKDGHGEMKGTLKIHGQSKPATFDVTQNSPTNLSLKGTVKRADYAMTDDPDSQNHFGDTITLMFDVQAVRQ